MFQLISDLLTKKKIVYYQFVNKSDRIFTLCKFFSSSLMVVCCSCKFPSNIFVYKRYKINDAIDYFIALPKKCSGAMCMMHCENGFQIGPDGCEICKCKQGMSSKFSLRIFVLVLLVIISGATDIPVLDFWWRLPLLVRFIACMQWIPEIHL